MKYFSLRNSLKLNDTNIESGVKKIIDEDKYSYSIINREEWNSELEAKYSKALSWPFWFCLFICIISHEN